jgi:hypothetical protein
MISTIHIAFGFNRILLIAGFLMMFVCATSVSASARTILSNNKILRIRGGGGFDSALNTAVIKDSEVKTNPSIAPLMHFADVAVASPSEVCNATTKVKRPYQYYF